LQGGGATFWQAKNGGFWGPGGRADARAQDTFSFTFLVIEKDIWTFLVVIVKYINLAIEVFFERIVPKTFNCVQLKDIRSLPKGRSPFNNILIITYYTNSTSLLGPAQRG
jgi:hypothetical protein